jgi:hypothetical protein
MAIDKALYEAPVGIADLAEQEPDIEIEIEDPESVDIKMGDLEVELVPGEETAEDFDANLAEDMDERVLATLATDLLGDYDSDVTARKDWLNTYVKGLKLLGLEYEERTEPWSGACGVFHPILMESAVKFQSETIMETFPAMGPVKTKIIGRETPEKKEAATRVADDMNYQLTEVMQEYRPEHERMLISLCLSGNAFKKIYFDPSLDRQTAMFIPAEDLVVPYGAANLESAERVTHKMRKTKNEILKLQDAGFQLLEMHVELDLEGDPARDVDEDGEPTGIALPYIVTIEKGTMEVLSIRRNWLKEDPLRMKRQHFVHYGYIPGFGFYSFGLIHLIGGHAKAATSLMRQLVDAGTLSNLPGGLKTRGLRIKGDDTPISPGEFRDVDLPSGTMRDNILPLPYKEPSQVLVGLMDKIVEDGRRFAAVADLKISDTSAQSPVGTTLAVLERMLKVMSAVQARIYYTMKQEFKLLAGIIRDNTPDEYSYEPEVGDRKAKQSDYDQVNVIPVSDPNASTMSQRVVQYQAVLQLAQSAPQLYNLPMLHRQMIETLGVKNAEKLVPIEDDMKPTDPVTENMNVLNGKPVKAFIAQDHEAHLAVHMAAMKDPKLAQIMGQNPQAQALQAAGMAHIMEHVAFAYRNQIEQQLGASLPSPEDNLKPEIENQLSRLVAQAAQQLLQKNSGEMAQQQAQQQAQDPLIQMQQQELQIKAQEAATKEKKVIGDLAAKEDELRLKEMELNAKHEADGLRIGVDIRRSQAQMQQQANQAATNAAKPTEKPTKK